MFRYSRTGRVIAVLVCALAVFGQSAGADVQFNTVALSGSSGSTLGLGPNVGAGVNFNTFRLPALNADGKVAFLATLAGSGVDATNDDGIFANVGGPLAVLARSGSAGPGPNLGAGLNFVSFFDPNLNADGKIAFGGTLTQVNGIDNVGIWQHAVGSLSAVAVTGGLAPAPSPGPVFLSRLTNIPSQNPTGTLAFVGRLSIFSPSDEGIFTAAGGTITAVAQEGSTGPGPNLGAGVDFDFFDNPTINASGAVAFAVSLNGTAVDETNDRGIFTNVGGTIAAVAREGASGPGPNLGAGVIFSELRNAPVFPSPVINDAGAVAFYGKLSGTGVDATNDDGIFSTAGGAVAVVARAGNAGPGPNLGAGVNFSTFLTAPLINGSGELAFLASLTGTGVDSTNNTGIFSTTGGTLAAIARKGSAGPGPNLGAGVNFGTLGAPVLNSDGYVAFTARLTGAGVNSTNDSGLFTNAGGVLMAVVRTGDLFDVDPNAGVDLRTISAIGFLANTPISSPDLEAGGGEDGRRITFNDAGMLTFRLTFTDGSSGIFTALVPEPAGLGALAVTLTLLRRRQYRSQ